MSGIARRCSRALSSVKTHFTAQTLPLQTRGRGLRARGLHLPTEPTYVPGSAQNRAFHIPAETRLRGGGVVWVLGRRDVDWPTQKGDEQDAVTGSLRSGGTGPTAGPQGLTNHRTRTGMGKLVVVRMASMAKSFYSLSFQLASNSGRLSYVGWPANHIYGEGDWPTPVHQDANVLPRQNAASRHISKCRELRHLDTSSSLAKAKQPRRLESLDGLRRCSQPES